MKTADNLSQRLSSTCAVDSFFNDVPYFWEIYSQGSKGSNHSICSRISSWFSNGSISEREYNATEAKLYVLQVEVKSKWKLTLKKKEKKKQ